MPVFTLDKMALVRSPLDPTNEDFPKSIMAAGNKEFEFIGHDQWGMPIIECEVKPKDFKGLGIVWLKEIEA